MICPRCKTPNSDRARFCSRCGFNIGGDDVTPVPAVKTKEKKPFLTTGGIICFLLVAVVSILYLIGVVTDEGHPATGTELRAKPVLEISARDLWIGYDENEVLADSKFKGRTLRVTGIVVSVDKDITGNVVVSLGGTFEDGLYGRMPNPLMLTLARLKDGQQGRAAQLRKGNLAIVLCRCDGRLMGSPTLSDCIFKS